MRYTTEIELAGRYDVVVCGGGPAGTAAALAARREGLSVLIVEGQGQLGGMGTSGLVSHWLGGRTHDGKHWVVGGIFRRLAEEAAARGFALLPRRRPGQKYTPHGWLSGLVHGIPFDPFRMATFLDEQTAAAGVDVLLATQAVDVLIEANRITHVVIHNKGGLQAVVATAVIDATGDADIAARSGCHVLKGDDAGLMAPATLEFHVDHVDQDALAATIDKHDAPRFRRLIEQLRRRGVWTFPYEIFISVQLNEKGTVMINTPRICGVDGASGASVTDGLIRGRAEIAELFDIMRTHFPGFANAHLKAVAPALGVRETRRIVGDFVLKVDDLLGGTAFADTIGFTSYGWDLPDPKRPSYQPMHERKVQPPRFTPIPYRVMTPRPVANLVCPGRAVSVERHVLGPVRVMAPCMAMGEAAGAAAAQVVHDGRDFATVDTDELRTTLRRHGAIVDRGNLPD